MPPLFVAHYGHPLLKGARHWTFLLPGDNSEMMRAYQITGSTNTYAVKAPEDVWPDRSQSYMGKVEVGSLEEGQRDEFESVVLAIPVTRGNIAWNCQNWIIEALGALKERGFSVKAYSLTELQELLAGSSQ